MLKDMGEAKYYMGCQIARDHKARKLKLVQHLYVKSMVKTFGVENESRLLFFWGVSILSKEDELQIPEENEKMLEFPYREALGAPMWTSAMTRP